MPYYGATNDVNASKLASMKSTKPLDAFSYLGERLKNKIDFNMINLDADEEVAELVIPTKNVVVNRQSVPTKIFDMTTVAYVSLPEYILRAKNIFEGTVRAAVIPPERAIDIDNPLDLEFAEFLLNRQTP